MRIALLTEGGFPFAPSARSESGLWCDRLLRGLGGPGGHTFDIYALSRSGHQDAAARAALPPSVLSVRTAPLWGPPPWQTSGTRTGASARDGGPPSGRTPPRVARRTARRYAEGFAELAGALCTPEPHRSGTGAPDRFATGLYALADIATAHGGLGPWLHTDGALRVLESACRAPGAPRAVHSARVPDLLTILERLERVLRPLSLDWYGLGAEPSGPGQRSAALCHAVGGGPAALPGLLARRYHGTPLLITEHGVRLREHYLASAAHAVAPSVPTAPVRALLTSLQVSLTRVGYAAAALITPGTAHVRRWQERCGADGVRLRTVYPGMDTPAFHDVGEAAAAAGRGGDTEAAGGPAEDAPSLVWAGRIEPAKDVIGLLHAFAAVRREVPAARLRIVSTSWRGAADPAYLAHCRSLAAHLFPDEASGPHAEGRSPVSFTEVEHPDAHTLASVYAGASVAVLSSVVEGFPVPLVESMFCARPTVSTDVGAVCEVVGGTGLVVPPRNPKALAAACAALLRDPGRRARLGAAARARALELFTVEQNLSAYRGIYRELAPAPAAPAARFGCPGAGAEGRHPAPSGAPVRTPVVEAGEARRPRRVPSWAREPAPATTGGPGGDAPESGAGRERRASPAAGQSATGTAGAGPPESLPCGGGRPLPAGAAGRRSAEGDR